LAHLFELLWPVDWCVFGLVDFSFGLGDILLFGFVLGGLGAEGFGGSVFAVVFYGFLTFDDDVVAGGLVAEEAG